MDNQTEDPALPDQRGAEDDEEQEREELENNKIKT